MTLNVHNLTQIILDVAEQLAHSESKDFIARSIANEIVRQNPPPSDKPDAWMNSRGWVISAMSKDTMSAAIASEYDEASAYTIPLWR